MIKVSIVGAIPPPVGGISTYIYRFCNVCAHMIDEVIDLYPSDNKLFMTDLNIRHSVCPRNILRVPWLYMKILLSKSEIIYFNFSAPFSLILCKILPKRYAKWYLLLHHGELEGRYNEYSTLVRYVIKSSIKRFDRVFYINQKQQEFYKNKLYLDTIKLVNRNSYVPPLLGDIKCFSTIPSYIKSFLQTCKVNILCSGYGQRYGQYHRLCKYVSHRPDVGLIICIYGTHDVTYMRMLETFDAKYSNILLVQEDLTQSQFLRIIQQIDIYARTHSIDSFGIATADATIMGKIVIATDACERERGIYVYSTNNDKELYSLLDVSITSIANNTHDVDDYKYSIIESQEEIRRTYITLFSD